MVVTLYTRLWILVWLPTLTAIVVAGMFLVSTLDVVASVLLGAGIGTLASLFEWPHRPPHVSAGRRATTWAVFAGTAAGAIAVLAPVLGNLLWSCLAMVGATSPLVIGCAVRLLRRPPPTKMTDRELCRTWRSTTAALRAHPSTEQAIALAARRERLLDEMESRNPPGLKAWLDTGSCADDALEEFFIREGGSRN